MRMTKTDYERRASRLADGTSVDPDEDRRLVALYEREGFALESADGEIASESHAVELSDGGQGDDSPRPAEDAGSEAANLPRGTRVHAKRRAS